MSKQSIRYWLAKENLAARTDRRQGIVHIVNTANGTVSCENAGWDTAERWAQEIRKEGQA